MPPKTKKNSRSPTPAPSQRQHLQPQPRKEWDGLTTDLQLIAHGSAGMVYALDSERVVKVYVNESGQKLSDIATERQAYRNLNSSGLSLNHVLKCLELENEAGLVLERCVKTVRRRMRSKLYVPQKEALGLAIEATRGLVCLHRSGIVQGDVGCHNMLLDSKGVLKIADFAGSLIMHCTIGVSVDYEVKSKLPDERQQEETPTVRSDIFALGSAIYEMMTRKVPYFGRPYAEAQELFKQGKFPEDFPDDSAAGLRSVVEMCWRKGGVEYVDAEEVLVALIALTSKGRRRSSTASRTSITSRTSISSRSSATSSKKGSPKSIKRTNSTISANSSSTGKDTKPTSPTSSPKQEKASVKKESKSASPTTSSKVEKTSEEKKTDVVLPPPSSEEEKTIAEEVTEEISPTSDPKEENTSEEKETESTSTTPVIKEEEPSVETSAEISAEKENTSANNPISTTPSGNEGQTNAEEDKSSPEKEAEPVSTTPTSNGKAEEVKEEKEERKEKKLYVDPNITDEKPSPEDQAQSAQPKSPQSKTPPSPKSPQTKNQRPNSKRRNSKHASADAPMTHFAQSLRTFLVGRPRYIHVES